MAKSKTGVFNLSKDLETPPVDVSVVSVDELKMASGETVLTALAREDVKLGFFRHEAHCRGQNQLKV